MKKQIVKKKTSKVWLREEKYWEKKKPRPWPEEAQYGITLLTELKKSIHPKNKSGGGTKIQGGITGTGTTGGGLGQTQGEGRKEKELEKGSIRGKQSARCNGMRKRDKGRKGVPFNGKPLKEKRPGYQHLRQKRDQPGGGG